MFSPKLWIPTNRQAGARPGSNQTTHSSSSQPGIKVPKTCWQQFSRYIITNHQCPSTVVY